MVLIATCWAYGHCVMVNNRTFCHRHITQSSLCQIHVTFLCVSFVKKLLVMFSDKTGKGFLAWNRQLFNNIIIKQLQPPLTHVTKPKGTLQSASTASHVLKYRKIAILKCFGNYACVVNMMSIHTIYMLLQQEKTGAKSVLGDSKFVQIMNIQPKGEIAYLLTCL